MQVPVDVIQRLGLSKEEAGATFYRGHGCSRCKDSGFLGRMAILEVLEISHTLRDTILHNTSAQVVREQALKDGMKTLKMAGLNKAKAGLTSLDEVLRVTGGSD